MLFVEDNVKLPGEGVESMRIRLRMLISNPFYMVLELNNMGKFVVTVDDGEMKICHLSL